MTSLMLDKTGIGRPMVSLQINLAPTDLPTARYTLPHQLRQWAGQTAEIVLTLDLHKSRGRYAEAWRRRLPGMRELIAASCAEYSHAHAVDVDYSEEAASAVAEMFFGSDSIPSNDRQGAPYYAYLFGLYSAQYDYVLHMDSDVLYGGGSQNWIQEALEIMQAHPEVIACNPLPGPPTADGRLCSQDLPPYPYSSTAFSSRGISTRIFLIDRRRLMAHAKRLKLSRPAPWNLVKALIDGQPPHNPLEVNISEAMVAHGLIRVDFLGEAPGMWAVHPPYRSARFFEGLPDLIGDIEQGNVPEEQRGDHELNDSMVDWAGARQTVAQEVRQHIRLATSRLWPVRERSSE